jgi:hypothetical protein
MTSTIFTGTISPDRAFAAKVSIVELWSLVIWLRLTVPAFSRPQPCFVLPNSPSRRGHLAQERRLHSTRETHHPLLIDSWLRLRILRDRQGFRHMTCHTITHSTPFSIIMKLSSSLSASTAPNGYSSSERSFRRLGATKQNLASGCIADCCLNLA